MFSLLVKIQLRLAHIYDIMPQFQVGHSRAVASPSSSRDSAWPATARLATLPTPRKAIFSATPR